MPPTRLVNRNIVAKKGRTSMRLEPELWDALHEICARQGMSVGELVRAAEHLGAAGGRTSAVRVYALSYFRAAATEPGHAMAGHGRAAGPGHHPGGPADGREEGHSGGGSPSIEM